ncbi:RBPJ-interacting and tubulin-associated protein 1 [Rhineura floridana]|uniref:RBPJ-interacting and tubulin-associated protein 1 n=1 Tax=Rhineura floridana TaxID=261503 RepID=UPI002AC844B1|nr:RBPJ-interacting and tubulin-associated protein 1 [Rhineura floridana]XP_061458542.1 RBPJ-interacting and tubulin-associated protein 1 [Rhineura floridana]
MKAAAALGIPPRQFQRSGRGGYRVKAKASYVDESLFGSRAGCQDAGAEFDPPWMDNKASSQRPLLWSPQTTRWEADAGPLQAAPPASTPRKRNKYRLKSHTPSYCDETLFGSKLEGQEEAAHWMAKGGVSKLCPLLWTPPSAARDQPALSPRPQETLPKALHAQRKDSFGAQHGRENSFWKHPENCSDSRDSQDLLGRARSQSLIHPYSTSDRVQPPVIKPRTYMEQDHRCSVASPGYVSRPSSKGLPGSLSARVTRVTSSCKPKPPWK